jgi:hypothetical protein
MPSGAGTRLVPALLRELGSGGRGVASLQAVQQRAAVEAVLLIERVGNPKAGNRGRPTRPTQPRSSTGARRDRDLFGALHQLALPRNTRRLCLFLVGIGFNIDDWHGPCWNFA